MHPRPRRSELESNKSTRKTVDAIQESDKSTRKTVGRIQENDEHVRSSLNIHKVLQSKHKVAIK